MTNWTNNELMEYMDHVKFCISRLRGSKRWYHSFRTRRTINKTITTMEEELTKVRNEACRRIFING